MTLAPSVFLVFLSGVVCLYWSLPPERTSARAALLVATSSVVVFLISPIALLVAVTTALVASALSHRLATTPSRTLLWTSVAAIVLILAYSRTIPLTSGVLPVLDLAGSAFFTLKAGAILSDGYRYSRATRPLDALLLVLFFPTYEAGPIEQPSTLNRTRCDARPEMDKFVSGSSRILIGLAKQSYLGPVLIGGLEATHSPWGAGEQSLPVFILWLLLKWLQIYVMFSGYSDVAIGAARLFGINVRENFNFPFMARNIQDFWKRWHISLIDFMSAYIYQPLVRKTGWRFRGILVLFLLTGLWHAFNAQYFVWGLLHGGVMIAMARWQRSRAGDRYRSWLSSSRIRSPIAGAASRALTILFVIWVSAIGSSETWARAMYVLTFGAI